MKKNNLLNMGMLRFAILLYFFMGLSSCSNRSITNDDIDKFILKYHDETFSNFIGVSISYRDSDFGDNIYMVAKQGGKFPPYIVHFNKEKNEITSVDDKLLKQSNCKNYFNDTQIKDLMISFIGFNVQNLSVDSNRNVFVCPFYGEHSPILLRLSVMTNEKVVKKGYVYELYKDNWYLSKTK
jgi:hypothetical protein